MWDCITRCTEHVRGSGPEHFLHSRGLQLIRNLDRVLLLPRNFLSYIGRGKPKPPLLATIYHLTAILMPQIDLLFASTTLWVWDTEKRFKVLKLEHADLVDGKGHRQTDGGLKERENGCKFVEDVGGKASEV